MFVLEPCILDWWSKNKNSIKFKKEVEHNNWTVAVHIFWTEWLQQETQLCNLLIRKTKLWLCTYKKRTHILPYLPTVEFILLRWGKKKFCTTDNSFISKKFIAVLKSWFLFKHQASMDIWIFLTCKMIPPHYISETHWWATGRVVFTFQRLMISPYHIH